LPGRLKTTTVIDSESVFVRRACGKGVFRGVLIPLVGRERGRRVGDADNMMSWL